MTTESTPSAPSPDEDRLRYTRRTLARLVLSHDAACYFDWLDPAFHGAAANWHYLHIENDVLPALRERGITEKQINQMLMENPRRYFERVDPY